MFRLARGQRGDVGGIGDAKEAQAHLHARIRDLEDKITRSVVINHAELDHTKALVGAKVRVLNRKTKKEVTYTLVSPVEADMASGKISTKSPVGQALLGARAGQTVGYRLPDGREQQVTVSEIAFQPEASGQYTL